MSMLEVLEPLRGSYPDLEFTERNIKGNTDHGAVWIYRKNRPRNRNCLVEVWEHRARKGRIECVVNNDLLLKEFPYEIKDANSNRTTIRINLRTDEEVINAVRSILDRQPILSDPQIIPYKPPKKPAFDKNLILYGPPGTGKTYHSAIYAVAICDGMDINDVPDYNEVMTRCDELKAEGRIAFVTFHQSYGYEDFMEGIRPTVHPANGSISYRIEAGIFKAFCDAAGAASDKPYVFIIDEINRGNISKIFGELITLIEDIKRSGMPEAASATLPYSGESFSVPSNVYILGTMNTADRSIALMDTALRRRFRFVEMLPDTDVLRSIGADRVRCGSDEIDIAAVLDTINDRICALYDREHTIGHAFFTGLSSDPSIEKLAAVFSKSVLPLLQEYFYEDYEKIQLVLGDNAKSDPGLKFILDEVIKPRNIFKGSTDNIDLPEKKYTINRSAFYRPESYKQIL